MEMIHEGGKEVKGAMLKSIFFPESSTFLLTFIIADVC